MKDNAKIIIFLHFEHFYCQNFKKNMYLCNHVRTFGTSGYFLYHALWRGCHARCGGLLLFAVDPRKRVLDRHPPSQGT